ncbi:Taurine catabolism dioxygenase TauD, TfdA family [Rhodococcus rhodochrous]|uniref:TauD/TfdA family dioxygenase n=1 Tax=Rhodococcus rhodochrous TaxID=1829 RepID=UPI00075196C5|nr:TauD/TfdA family dioxygenase [Rhodococcus rhodochrous]MDO1485117.1 TauD/TfdA family dioxygenase [Rhodococcus rhodochrous]SNV09984.1 Taurine catabolism dioxygenase TauD, TfdA family [Rhodococcus rhodochrous]
MTVTTPGLRPVTGPAAWTGAELRGRTDWVYLLTEAEIAELEAAGRRFVTENPDLRTVTKDDYPLPVCADGIARWSNDLDRGRGFVLVRGLRTELYSDAVSGAIFFLLGLHLGVPMPQNQHGDLLDHVVATSNKTMDDPEALPSRVRDKLEFHSDSSDVVGLICLRGAASGGESRLVSGAALYNRVLELRPDLAPLMLEPWYWDWYKQDHDAPSRTYVSPMVSDVDGVFSIYAGGSMIRSAQDYDEVPRLTEAQRELLDLIPTLTADDDLPLDMQFQPGDIQWLLNYAALHSRREFVDYPVLQKRRHLLRLWLRRHEPRPLVEGFGKPVTADTAPVQEGGAFTIGDAVIPKETWGL